MLLEKAHEYGEIGAGIRLGPNAFSALDGVFRGGRCCRQRAVFTDHITMMDAVNAEEVVCIETGRRRFSATIWRGACGNSPVGCSCS